MWLNELNVSSMNWHLIHNLFLIKLLLRKGKKSSVVTAFVMDESTEVDQCIYVLGGRHILHSIVWPRPATYEEVINNYASQIISQNGDNFIAVFDGQSAYTTTKGINKKEQQEGSAYVNICENTVTTKTQVEFLKNSINKKVLIQYLSAQFRSLCRIGRI